MFGGGLILCYNSSYCNFKETNTEIEKTNFFCLEFPCAADQFLNLSSFPVLFGYSVAAKDGQLDWVLKRDLASETGACLQVAQFRRN